MSKGNTLAENLPGALSVESILITGESNWIQMQSFWREARGQRLGVMEGMSCHLPRATSRMLRKVRQHKQSVIWFVLFFG